MLKVDTRTVGGRIRYCRTEKRQTIKVFAEELQITANYVGQLERNVRSPSLGLLEKISQVCDVSYDWLLNGTNEAEVPVKPARVPRPNLQMMLTILMLRSGITKEAMGSVLNISGAQVEQILNSREIKEYPARYERALPFLVSQLNIPAVRAELQEIDAFLEQQEEVVMVENVQDAAFKYVSDTCTEPFSCTAAEPVTVYFFGEDMHFPHGPSIVNSATHFVTGSKLTFHCMDESRTGTTLWYMEYLPFPASVSGGTAVASFIERACFSGEYPDKIARLSIIFDKEKVYDAFTDQVKAKGTTDGNVPVSDDAAPGAAAKSNLPQQLSVLLLDMDQHSIIKSETLAMADIMSCI